MMTSTSSAILRLTDDSIIVCNLKACAFKMAIEPTAEAVTEITSSGNVLFVSVLHCGLTVYRVEGSTVVYIGQIGGQGTECSNLLATSQHLSYMLEAKSGHKSICVHPLTSLIDNNDISTPQISHIIRRYAPFTIHSAPGLLIIGGAAWSASWTSDIQQNTELTDVDESHVVLLDLNTFSVIKHWKAVEHSVAILHAQEHCGQCLLGVADSRSGICVYDIGQSRSTTNTDSQCCLYKIDVEEVRSFQLVGPCVAVFHRFEPNVSFWNITEQRTILCINIQDQTRRLTEEFTVGDDFEECDVLTDQDDHVTTITSLPVDGGADFLLVYGTMSGCVFGFSVHSRTKVFSIPYPHEDVTSSAAVQGVSFLPSGQLVVAYRGCPGVTVMNFGLENPPDRPPTRSNRREK